MTNETLPAAVGARLEPGVGRLSAERQNPLSLSPLNFRGLLHTMHIVGEPGAQENPTRIKRRAIECWRCAECHDVHDWESDAEECCAAEDAKEAPSATACPVCAQKYETHRDATDCCLWKDLSAQRRWQMADAVEAGSTWVEQLLTPNVGAKLETTAPAQN